MKVPQYESQSAIPREGQARFVTAQLSSSAMEAPALAFAKQGQQLADLGGQISTFALKKAQAGAETEAAAAASSFQVDLAGERAKAMSIADPVKAEKAYKDAFTRLQKKHSSTLTNTLARREYATKIGVVQSREIVSFVKENNKRVIEQVEANVDSVVQSNLKIVADPNQSEFARMIAAALAITKIDKEAGSLGPETTAEKKRKTKEAFASQTLANIINNPNEKDASGQVEAFLQGRSSDPVLKEAIANMLPETRQKIGNDALKVANNIIKGKLDAANLAEKNATKANDETYRQIINADFNNEQQRQQAEYNYRRLVAANYFKKRSDILAIEALFNRDQRPFAEDGSENQAKQAALEAEANAGTLTLKRLLDARSEVTYGFYSKMLPKIFDNEKTSKANPFSLAKQYLKAAFQYEENASDQYAKDNNPIVAAYNAASVKLLNYVNANQNKPDFDPYSEATKIYADLQKQYAPRRLAFLRQQMKMIATTIPGQPLGNMLIDDLKVLAGKVSQAMASGRASDQLFQLQTKIQEAIQAQSAIGGGQ